MKYIDPFGLEPYNWVDTDSDVGKQAHRFTNRMLQTTAFTPAFDGDLNIYVELRNAVTSESVLAFDENGEVMRVNVYLSSKQGIDEWAHEFGAVHICVLSRTQCEEHKDAELSDNPEDHPGEKKAERIGALLKKEADDRQGHEEESDSGNEYGIDPDGRGPAPDPCRGKGPLCK